MVERELRRRRTDARIMERRRKVLEMYVQGRHCREIWTAVGIGESQYYRDLHAALDAAREDLQTRAGEYLVLQYERLELAATGLAPGVMAGDLKAIEMWIKLSESTRKLLGLDGPVRLETREQGSRILTIQAIQAVQPVRGLEAVEERDGE